MLSPFPTRFLKESPATDSHFADNSKKTCRRAVPDVAKALTFAPQCERRYPSRRERSGPHRASRITIQTSHICVQHCCQPKLLLSYDFPQLDRAVLFPPLTVPVGSLPPRTAPAT
ncbi:hypothetical protein M407DRAFT_162006 [Tulasnella calospora MUT 4182]|uniref:Uncharacterized protein n=1 Tax=Tulasnella calospora MUT 4182 TaxID=1051891 RepID=A0A0C3L9L0_9AGAM|nr:hypothetical protein M407DRAFT_162006 [Tulasnella calospora MUT 4182]